MLHYLFTNDLRRNQWPEILVDSAKLIRDEAVPDQHEDKSKNNYINTQQSYLCIHKGTKANELCCKGDVNAVILNFINRFQFPNARTESSFNNAVAGHMAVAPLRCVVQLLFVLGMVDAGQAYMDCPEFAKYIICNSDVATGNLDLISLAQQIVSDRLSGVVIPPVPDTSTLSSMGIEWKHCPRQIGEVFYLLQFVPFIKLNGTRLELVMPSTIDANLAKMFFCIVNNHELWAPPNTSNWPDIQKSYLQYMDSGVTQYITGGSTVGSESLLHVDVLTVALKMFAEKRAVDKPSGWDSYDAWTHGVRTDFVAVDESLLANPAFDYLAYIRKFAISWQVANTKFASHSDDEKHAVLKFLKEHKDSPKPASWYIDVANRLVVGGNQVKGMSQKAVLYFMSELHPEEFAAWTEPTYEQLAYLGLHKGAVPSGLTIATYEDCKSKQQQIVARMKELGIGKASDDSSDPDYRTANEFLWWLGQDDNKDLIKEKVMSKAMKPVERKPYDKTKGKKKTFASDAEDQLMLRILAALRTKPFVILAGHSGTGKSRMVKKLAYMTCRDNELHEGSNPGNYCMIEVKPNWHDSTYLLGYSSSFGSNHYVVKPLIEFIQKAYAYPDVPFFVCLDEMNLAPVEQYFAEFLSALEDIHEDTGAMNAYFALNANYKPADGSAAAEVVKYTSAPLVKALEYFDSPGMLAPKFNESSDWVKTHGLTIPKNLFVVGTVNMDETTNQFSRKVLDRAFTIEMTDARFEDFGDHGKDPAPSFVEEADIDHALIDALLKGKKQYGQVLSKKSNDDDPNGQLENMNALKGILADTPFVVAYRFANEYALYEEALNVLDGTDGSGNSKAVVNAQKAFDDVVLMKLLPRIAGEAAVVKALFEGVKKSDGTKEKSGLLDLLKCSEKGDQDDDTASGKKMREILKRGKRLLYLTFWP